MCRWAMGSRSSKRLDLQPACADTKLPGASPPLDDTGRVNDPTGREEAASTENVQVELLRGHSEVVSQFVRVEPAAAGLG